MFMDNFEVQLVDFGLSKLLKNHSDTLENSEENSNSTTTGFVGTLRYMAPELV